MRAKPSLRRNLFLCVPHDRTAVARQLFACGRLSNDNRCVSINNDDATPVNSTYLSASDCVRVLLLKHVHRSQTVEPLNMCHTYVHCCTAVVCTSTYIKQYIKAHDIAYLPLRNHPPKYKYGSLFSLTCTLSASISPYSLRVFPLGNTICLAMWLSYVFGFEISENLTLAGLASTRRTRQPSTASSQRQPSAGGPPVGRGCFEASGRTPALSSSSRTDEARKFRRSRPSLVSDVVGVIHDQDLQDHEQHDLA